MPNYDEGFSCVVAGKVGWTTLTTYGNCTPDRSNPYSTDKPGKAVIKIQLDVDTYLAPFLAYIEEGVFSNANILPNTSNANFKKNEILNGTNITMVSSIFKRVSKWKEEHSEEEIPEHDDPNGWIKDISDSWVYCPEDFCSFYRVGAAGIEKTEKTEITKGDYIHAKIWFAPYAFLLSKDNGVAGVRVVMEDVVLVKGGSSTVCSY